MGIGRAHDPHMELMRKSDIGDKLPLTSEQRQVFQACDGTAKDAALATHSSCRTMFRIMDWAASAAPELFRGQPRAFGHRRQFGPHNVGIDGSLADLPSLTVPVQPALAAS